MKKTKKKKAPKARKSPAVEVRLDVTGPKGASREERSEAIAAWIESGETRPLPGWRIKRVHWRNPDTKNGRTRHWQDDTAANAHESIAPILKGQFK